MKRREDFSLYCVAARILLGASLSTLGERTLVLRSTAQVLLGFLAHAVVLFHLSLYLRLRIRNLVNDRSVLVVGRLEVLLVLLIEIFKSIIRFIMLVIDMLNEVVLH